MATYSAVTFRSKTQRLLLGLAGAVVGATAALALAWFMYTLIHASEMRLSKVDQMRMLDFVRLQREETVERKQRKPQRPDLSATPEAPPAMDQTAASGGQTLTVSAPTPLAADVGIQRSGIGLGFDDGEYLPIVKVAPVYPRRALERGLNGTCLVRYTVTTAGTVKNVEVVPGQCSNAIFERPSVDAAHRFKYKPRIIDGEAVEVLDVYNMFHYERLEDREN